MSGGPRLGRERGRAVTSLAHLSTAGLAFGLSVILGAAVGYGVDTWLDTSPWGFLAGFLLGLAAGMMNVFRAAGVWSRTRDGSGPSGSAP